MASPVGLAGGSASARSAGSGAAGILYQVGELALCVDISVAPQDDVAGDAVVAGVVPAQGHRVVGCRGGQARGTGGRLRGRHCVRGRAGQRLIIARVVGEGHLHFDGLAFVGIGQGVGAVRRSSDCVVVGQPLVGEGDVLQPVLVCDAGGVCGEGLADPGGTANGRCSRGWAVGYLWLGSKANRLRRRTGQRLIIARVVCEGHMHFDGVTSRQVV